MEAWLAAWRAVAVVGGGSARAAGALEASAMRPGAAVPDATAVGTPPTKLAMLRDTITDEGHRSKLTGLYEYLHRNRMYLVHYQANKTYTSQVAESHIDALINARHKRTRKMQWTREGAHHVLQIRAMTASDAWESKCQDAVLLALGAAA
jgi:hypothetical protein